MLDDVKVRIAESAREIGGAQVQIMGNPRSVADARDSGEGKWLCSGNFARAFRHAASSAAWAIHWPRPSPLLESPARWSFHAAALSTLYLVGILQPRTDHQ